MKPKTNKKRRRKKRNKNDAKSRSCQWFAARERSAAPKTLHFGILPRRPHKETSQRVACCQWELSFTGLENAHVGPSWKLYWPTWRQKRRNHFQWATEGPPNKPGSQRKASLTANWLTLQNACSCTLPTPRRSACCSRGQIKRAERSRSKLAERWKSSLKKVHHQPSSRTPVKRPEPWWDS